MTYETVVRLSQISSLLLFVGLFAIMVVYAFWPGNRATFERAARLPIETGEDETQGSEGSRK